MFEGQRFAIFAMFKPQKPKTKGSIAQHEPDLLSFRKEQLENCEVVQREMPWLRGSLPPPRLQLAPDCVLLPPADNQAARRAQARKLSP